MTKVTSCTLLGGSLLHRVQSKTYLAATVIRMISSSIFSELGESCIQHGKITQTPIPTEIKEAEKIKERKKTGMISMEGAEAGPWVAVEVMNEKT